LSEKADRKSGLRKFHTEGTAAVPSVWNFLELSAGTCMTAVGPNGRLRLTLKPCGSVADSLYKFHLSVARFTIIRQTAPRVPNGLSGAMENDAIAAN